MSAYRVESQTRCHINKLMIRSSFNVETCNLSGIDMFTEFVYGIGVSDVTYG